MMKYFFFGLVLIYSQLVLAQRPEKAISFISNPCVCKDGSPIQPSSCAQFCSNRMTSGSEILFANFKVSEEISLGKLGSVYGWCMRALPQDTSNPMCMLEAKSKSGEVQFVNVLSYTNSNSIKANIDVLEHDEVYTLTLVETMSGARSHSIKFVKFSTVE